MKIFAYAKKSRLSLRSLLFFVLLALQFQIFAQTEYEESLVQKANDLELYRDDYWLLLGHYKKSAFGHKSLIDGKDFFLAPDGRKNPKAELEATIRSFFEEAEEGKTHPTYKYTSRYKWLCNKLDIDKSRLPHDGDTEFEIIKKTLRVKSFYLVFPAAYINSPVSMFGHLFFLVESEDTPHLAGMSVNYGAIATDPPGILYAIKGIFGAYPGQYDILPYHKQITKYSYLDMRDTWEYRLKLTDDENDTMMRHIIEMSFTYSDYWFLDENCAYCILFPIEAARPETKLTDDPGIVVEPVQVIKQLDRLNLLDEVNYRPSLFSKMQYEKKFLTFRQKRFVKKVCFGKASVKDIPSKGMTAEEQANLWEFASDYLKYLLSDNKITQKAYQKRFLEVLSERNKIKDVESLAKNIPTPDSKPHSAHGSHMVTVGGGIDDKDAYAETKVRVLAHSLMDRDDGFSPNSQIEFCNASVRYNFSEKKFSLRYADAVNVISLPMYDTLIAKKGFLFRAGVEQNLYKDGKETLAGHFKGAVGISNFILPCTQAYVLVGADSFFAPRYDYYTDILGGAEIGFITTVGIWKQKISGSIYQSPFEKEHTRFEATVEERLALGQNLTLNGFYSFSGDYRETKHSAGGSIRVFF